MDVKLLAVGVIDTISGVIFLLLVVEMLDAISVGNTGDCKLIMLIEDVELVVEDVELLVVDVELLVVEMLVDTMLVG